MAILLGSGAQWAKPGGILALPHAKHKMESLLAADLRIDRYMTYIVTREVKSESPNLAGLTAKTGN